MGMGNYAAFAEVVSKGFVEKISPEKFQNLIEALDEVENMSMEELAICAQYQEDIFGELITKCSEEDAKKIYDAYNDLCMDFAEKTDLSLYLMYHNAEDRGDEVNGAFWCVEGVYTYTPAGEKYKNEIGRKFWTNFG